MVRVSEGASGHSNVLINGELNQFHTNQDPKNNDRRDGTDFYFLCDRPKFQAGTC